MLSFLLLTQPYSEDPDSLAFRIHGTKMHANLEDKAKQLGLDAELSATEDGRNAIDLLEIEDDVSCLTDYKTWGSFNAARALGIVDTGKIPDPSGAKYVKSGKWGKAGSIKMVPNFQWIDSAADNYEPELQLNRYRILLASRGFTIDEMRVHVIVRDGGLVTAKQRGVFRNTYMIPVQKLANDYVLEYFRIKQANLQKAMNWGEWDTPCDDRESWGGNRCKNYCPVNKYCEKGRQYAQV